MRRLLFAALLFVLPIAAALAQVPSWTQPGPASSTGYPAVAQPFTASGTGTTSATVTVTQPTARTIYVCGVVMTESGGTAISANGSITNTINGAISFAQLGQLAVNFYPCIPGNGSSVVATTPTATAATASAVVVTGYIF